MDHLSMNFSYIFEEKTLLKLIETRNVKSRQFNAILEDVLAQTDNSLENLTLSDFFNIIKQVSGNMNYKLDQIVQLFEAIDNDCQGIIQSSDIENMILLIGSKNVSSLIDRILRSFARSAQIPGPLDVFDDSKSYSFDKIVDFMFRNRCEFKRLLTRSDESLVERFEQRINVIGTLLHDFYLRANKSKNFEEIKVLGDEAKVKQNEGWDFSRAKTDDLSSVSFMWLLKVVGSISSTLVKISPSFAEEAIDHTKWALNYLDFFQLSRNHPSGNLHGSLPKGVIEEMRSISHNLIKATDAGEVHLWFEFVCGDVGKILDIILKDSIPKASPLSLKLRSTRNRILQRESTPMDDMIIESDGVQLHTFFPNKICKYASHFNSKCLQLVNQVNDHFAVTYLKIMVGQTFLKKIQVFVCDRNPLMMNTADETLDSGIHLVHTLTGSECLSEQIFCFDQPICKKQILVRFESDGPLISNVGVSFYGVSLPMSLAKFAVRVEHDKIDNLTLESLLFLTYVAACQDHHYSTKPIRKFNFSTFSHALVNDDTGVLECNSIDMAMVSAQMPLSKDHPSFEIEVSGDTNMDFYVGVVGRGFNSSSQYPGMEPWSVAFHSTSGAIYEGTRNTDIYKSSAKLNEKLKWKVEHEADKVILTFERDGISTFRKECPYNLEFFPAIALSKGLKITLLSDDPWRMQQNTENCSSWLNTENISIEVLLSLMKKYKNDTPILACVLHLMYHLLPVISKDVPNKRTEELLDFIFETIDSQADDDVVKISQRVLSRGVRLFYPSEELRLKTFFELFDLAQEAPGRKRSLFTLEALCHYIAEWEPDVILKLPTHINDSGRILDLMQKLLTLTTLELLNSDQDSQNSSFLQLLSSLQTLIFAWCAERASDPILESAAYGLLSSYLRKFLEAVIKEMTLIYEMEDDKLDVFLLGDSLLSTSFRQLLVLLGQSCDWLGQLSRNNFLEMLKMCYDPIKKLVIKLCLRKKEWDISCHDNVSSIPWFWDAIASFFHLVGKLCGQSIQVVSDESVLIKIVEGSDGNGLLTSDIWRLIFRAGLQSSSKQEVQRTLSGKHGAVIECEALSFLLCLNEEDNESAKNFIKRCQQLSNKMNLVGGSHVTSAVVALFAALVWHTQPIRESLERYIASDFKSEIPQDIIHAYEAAEIIRMTMMKKRQDLIEEKEQNNETEDMSETEELNKNIVEESEEWTEGEDVLGGSTGEKIEVCENCPIADVKSKSEFLLQFAGLQKMQETEAKQIKNIGSSVDNVQNLKQSDLFAMYPSFQLVLDFVKDPLWKQTQVENLLESRRKQAVMLSRGYKHIREFLDTFQFGEASSNIPRFCVPTFLGGLLGQQVLFPKHHLDFIDGCGLLMETKVRREFYHLIKMMVSTSSQLLKDSKGKVTSNDTNSYNNCILAATLNFLSINWQVEDFNTLLEADVVEFLLSIILGFKPSDTISKWSLEEELETYSKYQEWMKEVDKIGINSFKYPGGKRLNKELEIERMLFVSRYQLKYDMSYRCDFCNEQVIITETSDSGGFYRCIECKDFDICLKCVTDHAPLSDHVPNHKLAFMKNVCKGCKGTILTRTHRCGGCPNFQWCTGCVLHRNFNHIDHGPDHELKMETLPPVSHQRNSKSCIAFYIQCHAALQLSNIALRSFKYIDNELALDQGFVRKAVRDFDYQRAVEQLYTGCVKGAAKILVKVCSEEKPESWKNDIKVDRHWGVQDILFGLLGKLLPSDETSSCPWNVWRDGEVFASLFKIISSERHKDFDDSISMALTMLRKIFKLSASGFSLESINEYIDSLLEIGVGFICRSHLAYSKLLIEIIRAPSSDLWEERLISKIWEKIINYKQETNKLSLIFHALVLIGFPKSPSFGCCINFLDDKKRESSGILLRTCQRDSYEVIDIETRRVKVASKSHTTFVNEETETSLRLSLSLSSIIDSLFEEVNENIEHFELMNWFFSILIKTQKTFNLESGDKSIIQRILPKIVQRFLEGHKLSRILKPSEIEVLVTSLVTIKFEGQENISGNDSLVGTDPLADVEDPDLKLQFEMLSEDDNILNRFICRAIYDLFKNDRETLASILMTILSTSILPDDVKEALKDVEAKYKGKSEGGEEMQIEEDLDDGFNLFGLKIKQEHELLKIEGVIMEDGNKKPAKVMSMKLIKEDTEKKQLAEKSTKFESLIKMSLERAKLDKNYWKMLLKKATDTLMNINCRHFLLNLLITSNFEEILKINLISHTSSLSSNEELWCSLVIYLFSKEKNIDAKNKLLKNVLNSSAPNTLELLVNIAHNFMLELDVIKNVDTKLTGGEGFIEMVGAESLILQLCSSHNSDALSTSASESPSAHLLISSSPSFDPVIHSLPLLSNMQVEIQDSKFYYKVDCSLHNGSFTAMQKLRSKELFNAGLQVIQHIIDDQELFRKVNANNMWIRLLSLFYELNSSKRVKVLSLIHKINASDYSVDLSLLSHAWNYFKRLAATDNDLKSYTDSGDDLVKPAIFLGLTELFASLSENENINEVISLI